MLKLPKQSFSINFDCVLDHVSLHRPMGLARYETITASYGIKLRGQLRESMLVIPSANL